MITIHRLIAGSFILLCWVTLLFAQDQKRVVEGQTAGPVVTASANAERVRFTRDGLD